MSCRRFIVVFILNLFLVVSLFAQSAVRAEIIYAEGDGFSLVSEGRKSSYLIGRDDVTGMELKAGDVLLTDDNSFLEIGFNRGNGVVKVAENTTFTIDELDSRGGAVLRVNYGRIRVRISSLLQGGRLWVSGYDTVAGVRGTDFGYDLFYDRATQGSERQTVVYCFDGAVDVLQYEQKNTSKIDLLEKEPYLLEESRMVSTSSAEPTRRMKSRPIESSILEYWDLHPFIGQAGAGIADVSKAEVSDDLKLKVPVDTEKWRFENGGKIMFATGVGMMTIGGILRAVAPDSVNLSTGLLAVGGFAAVGGGGFMIYSISLP